MVTYYGQLYPERNGDSDLRDRHQERQRQFYVALVRGKVAERIYPQKLLCRGAKMRGEGRANYMGKQNIRVGRCSEARAEGVVVRQRRANPEKSRLEGSNPTISKG